MTAVQPPRHRAPAGAQGFGREPHPSGPVVITPRVTRRGAAATAAAAQARANAEPMTMPIPRAALDAARAGVGPVPPATGAPAPVMAPQGPGPMAPAPVPPRNGLGIAALVLGLCGLVIGLIPFFGLGAILLGIVGLVLGLVGVQRARNHIATNTGTAVAGVVACVLAVVLGIVGMVIVANAVTQLGEDLSAIGATTPAAGAPADPSAGSSAPATSAVAFGQTFTYADGLAVTVDPPAPYEASSTAAGDENPHAFSVSVRITNNTGAAFDPALLNVAMSTGGTPATQIFDSANNMGDRPQNQLQPGRSMTYEVAFSTTADSGEAQVDVVPSFSHDHAVFTGTL